jgi:hypothetical protein
MKPSTSRIERMLEKIEDTLVPPPRKWLRVIIHDGDDEAEAMEQALAEHIAAHPEDAGRTERLGRPDVFGRAAQQRSLAVMCPASHDGFSVKG